MHFRRPRLAQQLHDLRAQVVPRTMESSTSTTRLPFTVAATGFSLMRTMFSRSRLRGLDERAADVFVLDKADAVGDAALPGIAQRRVQAAESGTPMTTSACTGCSSARNAPARTPRHVDAGAVDHGIRAGKVDVLKHAGGLRAPRRTCVRIGAHAVLVHHHDLARLHDRARDSRADGVQRAALGGEDVVLFAQLPDAQGAEAVRVARGDELAWAT